MKQNTSGLSIHGADDNSKATAKLIGSKGEGEEGRVNARKPRWFFKARKNVEAREREAGGTLCVVRERVERQGSRWRAVWRAAQRLVMEARLFPPV